jgi:hypothetical protein
LKLYAERMSKNLYHENNTPRYTLKVEIAYENYTANNHYRKTEAATATINRQLPQTSIIIDPMLPLTNTRSNVNNNNGTMSSFYESQYIRRV